MLVEHLYCLLHRSLLPPAPEGIYLFTKRARSERGERGEKPVENNSKVNTCRWHTATSRGMGKRMQILATGKSPASRCSSLIQELLCPDLDGPPNEVILELT